MDLKYILTTIVLTIVAGLMGWRAKKHPQMDEVVSNELATKLIELESRFTARFNALDDEVRRLKDENAALRRENIEIKLALEECEKRHR